MRINELRIACELYKAEGAEYDESYKEFLARVKQKLNLENAEHRMALLRWLRQWDCRQFALAYSDLASSEILHWYAENKTKLSGFLAANLWELSENELQLAAQLYFALKERVASYKESQSGRKSAVKIGPTGGAKILFALSPGSFPPWDSAIRDAFDYDDSLKSYWDYLVYTKVLILDLQKECKEQGFQISELPEKLGRPFSSVPKLIDEYNWIKNTRML